jgi:hypothetical protein
VNPFSTPRIWILMATVCVTTSAMLNPNWLLVVAAVVWMSNLIFVSYLMRRHDRRAKLPKAQVLLLLLVFAGCENKAITYAKKVYPGASCDAIATGGPLASIDDDSAVCRWERITMRCYFKFRAEPVCDVLPNNELNLQSKMYPCPSTTK